MKATRALLFLLVLGLISVARLRAQEVRGYVIERIEVFGQCTTNRAVEESGRLHAIAAGVAGAYSGALVDGTLTGQGMTLSSTNVGDDLRFFQGLSAPAAGGYRFSVNTANGPRAQSVAVPAFGRRVPPGRIANFDEAQSVDASQPFTLRWDPTSNRGLHDQTVLRIFDTNDTAVVDVPLAKTDTSYTIPAGTLQPDQGYTAYLYLVHYLTRIPPTLTRPYVVVVESRRTRFAVNTRNPAGTLRFASNQVLARESDGVAPITVERTGGSEGTVTTDFYFEDVSAQAGVHYVGTPGTLTFGPGVTSQTVNVALLNDGVDSGPLVARVQLTNATGGAKLTRERTLDWTILDNGPVGLNVNALVLSKVFFYAQTNAAAPNQKSHCLVARFFASVHPQFPGAISNASVRIPTGRVLPLDMPIGTFLEHNEDFPSRLNVDRAFRPGAYEIRTGTLSDGMVSAPLRLGREPVFPAAHLSNWTEAQAIDSTTPFTLQWEPFAGATSNDYVRVSVFSTGADERYILTTPEGFDPGALPGTTTEFQIPANILEAGNRYHANIIFGKTVQCVGASNPATRACVIFAHTTGFDIGTAPVNGILSGTAAAEKSAAGCCGVAEFSAGSLKPLFDLALPE